MAARKSPRSSKKKATNSTTTANLVEKDWAKAAAKCLASALRKVVYEGDCVRLDIIGVSLDSNENPSFQDVQEISIRDVTKIGGSSPIAFVSLQVQGLPEELVKGGLFDLYNVFFSSNLGKATLLIDEDSEVLPHSSTVIS